MAQSPGSLNRRRPNHLSFKPLLPSRQPSTSERENRFDLAKRVTRIDAAQIVSLFDGSDDGEFDHPPVCRIAIPTDPRDDNPSRSTQARINDR